MIAPSNTVSSYFDANSATQPSGNCFIRLNNANAGAKVIKLSKSYIVGSTNNLFRYAYRAVLSNPGHACCQQPGVIINISITNTATSTTTLLACPQTSVTSGTSCGPAAPGFSVGNLLSASPCSYNSSWMPSSFDLSPYLGFQVTIDVYALDCSASGHAGYVYFDAQCGSFSINNVAIASSNLNISTCGASSITLNAPPNSGPYTWGSSGIFIPSNLTVPNTTNTSLSTIQTGSLTLTMAPSNWCSPKTITINVFSTLPPPAILQITQPTCLNSLATISLTTSNNATVTWSPPAVTYSSNVLVSQSAGFLGNIFITDTLGCSTNTAYFTTPIPTPPMINGALITPLCSSPTVNLLPSVSPSNYSNLNILYTGFPSGSLITPPNATVSPGVSTSSLNVVVSNLPGTYFFTITNTVTSCSASHSFVVLPCVVTGVKNNLQENNGSLIYPNPSNGFLNVELNTLEKNTMLFVYDSYGKMIFKELINEQKQKVKLTTNKGVYFYILSCENGLINQGKLVIE
jgi:hypothetical protein